MLKMLIVDDEYYIRKGIRETMDWASIGVEIVDEAEDGERALELVRQLRPDLMLMDIQMPFLDGLQLMEQLDREGLDVGIIVLSGHDDFEYAQKAIKSGVLDYILKPIESSLLRETVVRAAASLQKRRSHQHYQQLVEKGGGMLRSGFWRDVLLGAPDAAEARCKAEELGINLEGYLFQAVHLRLDEYDQLTQRLEPELLVALRTKVAQSAKRVLEGQLVEISPGEWAVVLVWHSTGEAPALRGRAEALFAEIEGLGCTVSLSASGTAETLTGLAAAFNQAWKDNRKFLPGQSSAVFGGSGAGHGEPDGLRPEIREALGYISKHYHEDITIQTVADKLYISPSHLMHLFKQDLNKTFNNCLTGYRMEAAKQLLREPGSRVYQIAGQVGYSDVKHFNKLFKRYTGLSPKEYVRQHYADL